MKSIIAIVLFVACATQVYSACVKTHPREPAPVYSALPYDPYVEVAPCHNNYYNYPYAYNYPYRHGSCGGCGSCSSCRGSYPYGLYPTYPAYYAL